MEDDHPRCLEPASPSSSSRRGSLAGLRHAGAVAAEKAPPESFFVVSAIFHYLGPAFAVLLFSRVEPLGVAWLRIASAAVTFALWRRPWRSFRSFDTRGRHVLMWWGLVLALMNSTFYIAIDRLPLGTVAAIEFLPVILLATIGARSPRNLAAVALAIVGVYLLTEVRLTGEPLGVLAALVNAGLFAFYIVLGHRAAGRGAASGIDGLATAMLVALVAATPIGAWAAAPAFGDAAALLSAVGVGITSSVIPYVTDQLAMARVKRSTYAFLVSLMPATATVVGIVVLGQIPSEVEVVGVVLVIVAVAVHRDRDAR